MGIVYSQQLNSNNIQERTKHKHNTGVAQWHQHKLQADRGTQPGHQHQLSTLAVQNNNTSASTGRTHTKLRLSIRTSTSIAQQYKRWTLALAAAQHLTQHLAQAAVRVRHNRRLVGTPWALAYALLSGRSTSPRHTSTSIIAPPSSSLLFAAFELSRIYSE